jgi:L-rhamnose mutarotase
MKRVAFKMKLKPGFLVEYKRRHDKIWSELSQALSEAGITDYSIFFDEESNSLFAVQKQSENSTADLLPQTEIVRKWWLHMAEIMEVNSDNSPVSLPLIEVFHQD